MIWIYGGAFLMGSGQGANVLKNYLYDGEEIATRGNVIVVTFNYRVGPLGFLSTGDSNLPGPLGALGAGSGSLVGTLLSTPPSKTSPDRPPERPRILFAEPGGYGRSETQESLGSCSETGEAARQRPREGPGVGTGSQGTDETWRWWLGGTQKVQERQTRGAMASCSWSSARTPTPSPAPHSICLLGPTLIPLQSLPKVPDAGPTPPAQVTTAFAINTWPSRG